MNENPVDPKNNLIKKIIIINAIFLVLVLMIVVGVLIAFSNKNARTNSVVLEKEDATLIVTEESPQLEEPNEVPETILEIPVNEDLKAAAPETYAFQIEETTYHLPMRIKEFQKYTIVSVNNRTDWQDQGAYKEIYPRNTISLIIEIGGKNYRISGLNDTAENMYDINELLVFEITEETAEKPHFYVLDGVYIGMPESQLPEAAKVKTNAQFGINYYYYGKDISVGMGNYIFIKCNEQVVEQIEVLLNKKDLEAPRN